MTTTAVVPTQHETELLGQTVVVNDGSSGIGLATASRARTRKRRRRYHWPRPGPPTPDCAGNVVRSTPQHSMPTIWQLSKRFFQSLPTPIHHVMVTAGGPYYARLRRMDLAQAAHHLEELLTLTLRVARESIHSVRPGGPLLFISATRARRPAVGLTIVSAMTAAMPALIANLALELAPVRVNLVAPGIVDTPLSATLLGDDLQERRQQLRDTLPIRRVVGPADVAALAVHIMANTSLIGATYDVDGGQQLLRR